MIEQPPRALNDRALKCRRERGQFTGFDLLPKIGENRGNVIDPPGRMRVAQQVKRRQFDGGDFHAASIRLALFNAGAAGRQILPAIKGQDRAPSGYAGHSLIRDDLKLHDGLTWNASMAATFTSGKASANCRRRLRRSPKYRSLAPSRFFEANISSRSAANVHEVF
jgi:hypothetical protein